MLVAMTIWLECWFCAEKCLKGFSHQWFSLLAKWWKCKLSNISRMQQPTQAQHMPYTNLLYCLSIHIILDLWHNSHFCRASHIRFFIPLKIFQNPAKHNLGGGVLCTNFTNLNKIAILPIFLCLRVYLYKPNCKYSKQSCMVSPHVKSQNSPVKLSTPLQHQFLKYKIHLPELLALVS